jgi:hypothetical protein
MSVEGEAKPEAHHTELPSQMAQCTPSSVDIKLWDVKFWSLTDGNFLLHQWNLNVLTDVKAGETAQCDGRIYRAGR